MSSDQTLIADLLQQDDDSLFEELGKSLLGVGPGMSPGDSNRFFNFGQKWFGDRKSDLQTKLCPHAAVQAIIDSPTSDRATQTSVIVDVLGSLEGYSSHAVVVAVLVVKFGLLELCRGFVVE